MTAFDTDILSEILSGNAVYLARAATIPPDDQFVPVVAAGELLRGWLNAVRQAEAGKGRVSLELVYHLFQTRLGQLTKYRVLPYTAAAESLFKKWKAAKIRVGSQDLRIAAICVAHSAKLVTRNRRDFEQVPGLSLEVWN